MKPRRYSLRVQMASQYALVTLVSGVAFVAVNFGVVERNTAGLTDALIGVSVITMAAVAAGWVIARYTLRPLRMVTAKAQQVSAANLHQRIELVGPDDELQKLATTIDELLARLEASFERERRFVANASHEIRTPLAVTRTALELGLNSTDPTIEELRNAITEGLDATTRSELLIADLLLLARSESISSKESEQFDLATLTHDVLNIFGDDATAAGIKVSVNLSSALTQGNVGLIDRLIVNVMTNAIRHNLPNGWINVTTTTTEGQPTLTVQNSSPPLDQTQIDELFEPFHRGTTTPERPKPAGHGLGLSIVRSIARSHRASVDISNNEADNIFEIRVSFSQGQNSR